MSKLLSVKLIADIVEVTSRAYGNVVSKSIEREKSERDAVKDAEIQHLKEQVMRLEKDSEIQRLREELERLRKERT